jgi:hypothetical protein
MVPVYVLVYVGDVSEHGSTCSMGVVIGTVSVCECKRKAL